MINRQLYERRSELMDRHLQFMLKQTEDYTHKLSARIKGASSDDSIVLVFTMKCSFAGC